MPFVLILATITIIWLIKKFWFSAKEPQAQYCPLIYRENICHCKLWHNCPVEVGWHSDTFVRGDQNQEISRAFECIESSVRSLSYTNFPQAVKAENIIKHALKRMDAVENESTNAKAQYDKFLKLLQEFMKSKGKCVSLIKESLQLFDLFQWTLEENELTDTDIDNEQVISNIKEIKRKILTELNEHGVKIAIAIDTEMVGAGYKGSRDMLARVSIVNKQYCIYDKYVQPTRPVTDYRTFVSGIEEADLIDADDFDTVQNEVVELMANRLVVGHDLAKDFNVLRINCPTKCVRDTALFEYLRPVCCDQKPSLKSLARQHLHRAIQRGPHSSVEDARAAMDLYLSVADRWEAELRKEGS